MERISKSRESYLVYGPPGSGKSTACITAASEVGIEYISVGDITRNQVDRGTDLGMELKRYLDVPIEYPTELIGRVMHSHIGEVVRQGKRFLMDGYPKYMNEAGYFCDYLMNNPSVVIGAIFLFNVPVDVAVSRVADRYICPSCQIQQEASKDSLSLGCRVCGGKLTKRVDDTESFVRRRYKDYTVSIQDTLEAIKGICGTIIEVDALKTQNEVVALLSKNMNSSKTT